MDLRRRIVTRVTDIRDRGQRLVQLNLELLVSELKDKGRKFGTAVGLFIAAGLLSLYALGFLLATIAVLIALVLPLWASLLIVTILLFVLVAVLVLVGRDQLRKIGDPKPEAAIAEATATAEMMKANARATVSGVAGRLRPRRSAAPQQPPELPLTEWSSAPPPPPSGPSAGSGEAARPAAPASGSSPAGAAQDSPPAPETFSAPDGAPVEPEPPTDPEKDA